MAPIRNLVARSERAFDPEHVKLMTTAYELAVASIPNMRDRPDLCELLAGRIIELACCGLRDPFELAALATENLDPCARGPSTPPVSRDRT